jgi:hypothetical protein
MAIQPTRRRIKVAAYHMMIEQGFIQIMESIHPGDKIKFREFDLEIEASELLG